MSMAGLLDKKNEIPRRTYYLAIFSQLLDPGKHKYQQRIYHRSI